MTGQKIWTSEAHNADWAICLARTDPDAPKHRGISYFLVDMHAPGIEVRPLREITGNALFNEVFLDEVFVGDDCIVGAPATGGVWPAPPSPTSVSPWAGRAWARRWNRCWRS